MSGSLGRCLEGSWKGCRLRKLLGAARAWPCSCSSCRLPALVPLTTAPFSLPLAGGARGYRGGKLSLGAGRAPRLARGSCWSGAQSPKGEVKDGRQQLPDPRKPSLQLPRAPRPAPPRPPRDAAAAGGTRIRWLRTDCSVLGCLGVFQTHLRCVSALGIPGQTLTSEAASAGPSSRRDLGNQVRFCQGSGGSREPGAFGRSQTLNVTSRINDCTRRPSSLHFLILKRRRWGWGSCRERLARTSVLVAQ